MKLSELLGDPAWLFDLGFPIQEMSGRVANPNRLEWKLKEEHMIPAFSSLSGAKRFADAYIAWSQTGIFFQAILKSPGDKVAETVATNVAGRSSLCSLYLDTRRSPDVHRATSFCQRFDFIFGRPSRLAPEQRGHVE